MKLEHFASQTIFWPECGVLKKRTRVDKAFEVALLFVRCCNIVEKQKLFAILNWTYSVRLY